MNPAATPLREFATNLAWQQPAIPLISNVTGVTLPPDTDLPRYWAEHLVTPVRFDACMATLGSLTPDVCLEIGPKPVLTPIARRALPSTVTVACLLDDKAGNWESALRAIGAVYACGAPVEWSQVNDGFLRRKERLPSYPFERQRFWVLDDSNVRSARHESQTAKRTNALLAAATRLQTDLGEVLLRIPISTGRFRYLADHTVFGAEVPPVTVFMELAQAAAAEVFGRGHNWSLAAMQFREPLVLGSGVADIDLRIQRANAEGHRAFSFVPRDENGATIYAQGLLIPHGVAVG